MVVFTCAHCGDAVHKPKVEKHYETKCRNKYPDLCCVDCLKDFRGDEHIGHTKCVTEAERYGGKGFVAKASQDKGARKQDAWIEIVQSVLDENKSLSGSLRHLLEKVSKQPNTPRKETKFINFVRSMDNRVSQNDISSAWSLLSAKLTLIKVNVEQKKAQNNAVNDEIKPSENIDQDKSALMEVDTNEMKSPKKDKKKKKSLENVSTLSEAVENGSDNAITVTKTDVNNQENSIADESSKKKQKKRKNAEVENHCNGISEEKKDMEVNDVIQNDDQSSKKNKKQKKQKDSAVTVNTEVKDISNENSGKELSNEVSQETVSSNDQSTKKNKKQKKQKNTINETATDDQKPDIKTNGFNDSTVQNDTLTNGVESDSNKNKQPEDKPTTNGVEVQPLSKKERKEQKKREKYEAELKQIETEKKVEDDQPPVDSVSATKKAKKRKLNAADEKQENIKSAEEVIVEKEEPSAKKVKGAESFDWTAAITSVLSGKNKEISMKKLEKKVMNEYCGTYNVTNITDRISKKFNKALKNIQNINIDNDKVSITCE